MPTQRSNRWRYLFLALALTFLVELVTFASDANASARPSQRAGTTFSDQVLLAAELESALSDGGSVELSNVTVRGTLLLPSGPFRLDATRVIFEGAVYRGVRDETSEGVVNGVDESMAPNIYISESIFSGVVRFSHSTFEEVIVHQSTFEEDADFSYSYFAALELNSSNFREQLKLSYAHVGGEVADGTEREMRSECRCLNLFDADLGGYADLTSIEVTSQIVTTQLHSDNQINIEWALLRDWVLPGFDAWVSVADVGQFERPGLELKRRHAIYEAQLRFWISNFKHLDRPRDAAEVNKALIRSRQTHLLRPWFNFEWWAICVLGVFTGFGTRPYRLLGIAFVVILVFALVFSRRSALEAQPSRRSFVGRLPLGLLVSADAFVPLLKIFDEKLQPKMSSRYRWLPILEKVLGLLIFGLAAYSVRSFFV